MADENTAVDAGASDGDIETNTEAAGAVETGGAEQRPGKETGTGADAGKAIKGLEESGKDEQLGELQKLRQMLAGGDDKFLKELERYKSIESISKAVKEARIAARNSGKPVRLSDKATEDEIKAYREAYGIPESAEEYPVNFRDGYQATEADKAILGEFRAAMHERSIDPKAAEAALEWYQDFAQAQQQELASTLNKVAKQTQAELRSEWGGEYEGNIGAASELMKSHLGEKGFEEMMDLRLMDGSRLQDNIAFVKMMAQLGTDYYGSNAIYNGDIETTSKTVQEKIDGLLKLRGGSKEEQEKYFSDATQAELTRLYQQRDKINSRK